MCGWCCEGDIGLVYKRRKLGRGDIEAEAKGRLGVRLEKDKVPGKRNWRVRRPRGTNN